MTKYARLTEQHITEYTSRLKHIDELLTRAREGISDEKHELAADLKEISEKREELASHLEEMRVKSREAQQEHAIEHAGPMGIWDALAQQLEKLVERL